MVSSASPVALIAAAVLLGESAGLLDARLSDGLAYRGQYASPIGLQTKHDKFQECNASWNATSTLCDVGSDNHSHVCCPSECPYEAGDTTYDDGTAATSGCFFRCVTADLCGAGVADKSKDIPDRSRHMCTQNRVANCNVTNTTDPTQCSLCHQGYELAYFFGTTMCMGQELRIVITIAGVVGVLLLVLLTWYFELLCRAHKNPKGLAEGKKYRKAAALGKHQVQYPLLTNLMKEAVGGVGTVLFFNFHCSVFVWGVLLLSSWMVLKYSLDDPRAFDLPPRITGSGMRPSEICRTVYEDHSQQTRHNDVQFLFLCLAYGFTFVFFVIMAIFQYRRFKIVDDDSQMSDFCALCYGLPTMEGDSVEDDLLKFFRSELGEDVVGVSVGWDYHHVAEQVQDCLEEDLYDLQSQSRQRLKAAERRRQLEQEEQEEVRVRLATAELEIVRLQEEAQRQSEAKRLSVAKRESEAKLQEERPDEVELGVMESDGGAKSERAASSEAPGDEPRGAYPYKLAETDQPSLLKTESVESLKVAKSRNKLRTYLRLIDHGLGFRPPKPKRSGKALWRLASFRLRTALALGGHRMVQTSHSLSMLRKLKTASAVFVVFRTENARDRACKMARGNGVWFAERRLKIMKQKVEPETVCWHNMYEEHRIWFILRMIIGVLFIMLLLFAYIFGVYRPYMDAMLSFDFQSGYFEQYAVATVYSLIVLLGNQIMYFASALVADKAGFHFEDTVQATYVILYNLAVLTQTAVDFFIAFRISKNKLAQFEVRAHDGELFGELHFESAMTYYTMQKELGFSYIVYCFPSCFLLPFIFEPIMLYLIPYHIQKLLVLSHPWVKEREAEKKLRFLVPMDLSRYGDLVLNVVLVSLGFVFLPAGFYTKLLSFFCACQAYIYVYDQYRILRFVPGFCVSNNLVNKFVEYLLAVPNGFLLAACVFRYHVSRSENTHPLVILHRMAGAFLLHVVVHWFILYKIVPRIGDTGHQASREDYESFAENTPASWFSSNPIHCLRSKHVHQQWPPCSFFFRGKEDLLQVNPTAGAYFKLKIEPVESGDTGPNRGSFWSRFGFRATVKDAPLERQPKSSPSLAGGGGRAAGAGRSEERPVAHVRTEPARRGK